MKTQLVKILENGDCEINYVDQSKMKQDYPEVQALLSKDNVKQIIVEVTDGKFIFRNSY